MAEPKGPIVLICGINPDGTLRTLEVDANDYLKVAMESPDLSGLVGELEEKLETADLELVSKIPSVGPHGWYSGAWQRQPLQLGYSATVGRSINIDDLGTGFNEATATAVAEHEIHVYTMISIMYYGTSPDSIQVILNIGDVNYTVHDVQEPGHNVWYPKEGQYVMAYTDYIKIQVWGATLHNIVYLRACGYRIDLDQ